MDCCDLADLTVNETKNNISASLNVCALLNNLISNQKNANRERIERELDFFSCFKMI